MAKICKVLLVEDQREIRELLHELFASEGYRFTIVNDGPAMRRAITADSAIDVVVIDVLLPGGVDGLTLANEAAARGLPVILVTGDHTRLDDLTSSGHPYLLKPFALEAFLALIEQVLRETAAQCERGAPGARGEKIVARVAAATAREADDTAGVSVGRKGTVATARATIVKLPTRGHGGSLFGRFGRVLRRSRGREPAL